VEGWEIEDASMVGRLDIQELKMTSLVEARAKKLMKCERNWWDITLVLSMAGGKIQEIQAFWYFCSGDVEFGREESFRLFTTALSVVWGDMIISTGDFSSTGASASSLDVDIDGAVFSGALDLGFVFLAVDATVSLGANVLVVARVVESIFMNIALATPEHFRPPLRHCPQLGTFSSHCPHQVNRL
jgi:hypothetical protein